MKLQTKIPLQKQTRNQIDYHSKIILLGSCFSENIGNKLSYHKFESFQNPFGILFHPKAIENLIVNAINERVYTDKDIFFNHEVWSSFGAHSSLSALHKNTLLSNLNSAIKSTHQQLKEATHIVITLGTSWVYRFIETDTIVANCHKIPQKDFLKEILSIDEVTESLDAIIALIRSVNKSAAIICTVSPVRHLKDGFIENAQSKSHLIAAVHQFTKVANVFYFPSYEIMMDELRDYRFYKEDMIHPNKTAVDYIWEKFVDSWISEKTKDTMQSIAGIQKGIEHKPFYENSVQHQQFLKNLEEKKIGVQKQFPRINFG